MSLYNGNTCGGTPCAGGSIGATCGQIKTNLQCASGTVSQVYVSVSSQAKGGSCTPSPQTPTVPPATWSSHAEVCAPAGAPSACGTAEVCVPSPASPFALCIVQSGDVACPPGPYTSKAVVDTGLMDGRTCTGCTCDTPAGAACTGGTVEVSPNATCGAGVMNAVPSTCAFDGIPANLPYYAQVLAPPKPSGGKCPPHGGMPVGSATPTGPVTICCQP